MWPLCFCCVGKHFLLVNMSLWSPCSKSEPQVWSQLSSIKTQVENDRWIVYGDFNQIVSVKDKFSPMHTTIKGHTQPRECLSHCELLEFPPKGLLFTWTNNRIAGEAIWARLDWALRNTEWIETFEQAYQVNLPIIPSGHGIMLFLLEKTLEFLKHPYRFEAMWLLHPQCKSVVKNA